MKNFFLTESQLQILKDTRHLTICEPKMRLERQQPGISADLIDYLGQQVTIYGPDQKKYGQAFLEAAFETSYGDPHPYLVSGMGFEADTGGFQQAYREYWAASFPNEPLTLGTILLVTVLRRNA